MKKYIVRGVEYSTQVDACSAVPVNKSTIFTYIRDNKCSFQEALDYYVNKMDTSEKYIVRGVVYESKTSACRAVPTIVSGVVHYSKRNKCSFQEALDYFINRFDNPEKYIVRGVEYTTKADACAAVPVNRSSVGCYCRDNKCSYQKALDYYVDRLDNAKYYVVCGKKYGTISEACSSINISPNHLNFYKKENNLSVQESLDYFSSRYDGRGRYIVRGIEYIKKKDACKAVPVPMTTVYFYCSRNNCSYQEALDYYVNKLDSRLVNPDILYIGRDGKVYLKAKCKECGRWVIISEDEISDYEHSEEECLRREI